MSSANQIWKFIYHNRYWFVIIAGVLIVGFFQQKVADFYKLHTLQQKLVIV